MGSVIDYGDCEKCGSEESFYTDYRYKTGEFDSFCHQCGKTQALHILRDEDYKPLIDEKGDIMVEEIDKEPYGVLEEESLKHPGSKCYSVLEVEEDLEDVKKQIADMEDKSGLGPVKFRQFDGEKIVEQILYTP
jgi:hypothetical protein